MVSFKDYDIVAYKVDIRHRTPEIISGDLEAPIIAQTQPEKGSLFSKMQNQNDSMSMSQNNLVRSASSTGRKLMSKIADKARKIKSSGIDIWDILLLSP